MDSNTKVTSFITDVKPNTSEISRSTLNKEESLPKNVRGVKGLARKILPTLASFTSQSENSPYSIEEGQARSVIPLGDTPAIVNASTHVGSDGPNKRMGEVLFPDHSKKHIHESL